MLYNLALIQSIAVFLLNWDQYIMHVYNRDILIIAQCMVFLLVLNQSNPLVQLGHFLVHMHWIPLQKMLTRVKAIVNYMKCILVSIYTAASSRLCILFAQINSSVYTTAKTRLESSFVSLHVIYLWENAKVNGNEWYLYLLYAVLRCVVMGPLENQQCTCKPISSEH